ncbi:MAG: hypothetical protein JSS77_01405 [Acidobacteria bacterium]|nr:hypothetical protein [Acidobacteriota bacterium]
MPKKNKPVNAGTARVRPAPKRKARAIKKVAASRAKRGKHAAPPQKLFDAMKWFGAFPELAGPTLKVQRQLRDEW